MEQYTENIMFIPACVLMVVEAVAFAFLVWAWFDAKKKQGDCENENNT